MPVRPALVATLLLVLGCTGFVTSDEVSETPPAEEAPSAAVASTPDLRFPVLDGDLAILKKNSARRVLEQVAWAEEQGLTDPDAGTTGVSILPLSPITPSQLALIRGKRLRFRYCFRKLQNGNPMASGFVRLDLRFDGGAVVGRGVERAGLTPGLQDCVHQGVRRWTFDEPMPEVVQLLVTMGEDGREP